ncbi:hypothetical protein AB1K18_13710 [Peribacillus simplex]|uniref:hypothetical protein n=1 Tax=Peribacillus simplex TaxID=1478 RepID=UPI003B8E112E
MNGKQALHQLLMMTAISLLSSDVITANPILIRKFNVSVSNSKYIFDFRMLVEAIEKKEKLITEAALNGLLQSAFSLLTLHIHYQCYKGH